MADAAFAMLELREEAGKLDGTTEERVILELMRFELDATEALRLRPGPGPAEVAAALALAAATRETLRAALVYNDYAEVRSPLAAACARLGLAVDAEVPDGRRLARRAAQSPIEVSDEETRREQGIYKESGLIAVVQRRVASPAADGARLPATLPAAPPPPVPLPAVSAAVPALLADPQPAAPLPPTAPAAPFHAATPLVAGIGLRSVMSAPLPATVASAASASAPAPAPVLRAPEPVAARLGRESAPPRKRFRMAPSRSGALHGAGSRERRGSACGRQASVVGLVDAASP